MKFLICHLIKNVVDLTVSASTYGAGLGSSSMCIRDNVPSTVKSRCSAHFPTPPKDPRRIEHAGN